MKKNVEKIIAAIKEITDASQEDGTYIDNATALNILAAAAGGIEYLPEYLECDACDCDDDDCDGDECDGDEDEDDSEDVLPEDAVCCLIGKGDRLTVPATVLDEAEEINGPLDGRKYDGDLTVIRFDDRIEVHFGDVTDDFEKGEDGVVGISLNHLNANGVLQFSTKPVFYENAYVDVYVGDDGVIIIA